MKKKGLIASLSLITASIGGGFAIYKFINKATKQILYRHHKEDNSNMIEEEFFGESVYLKNERGVKLRGILVKDAEASKTLIMLHPFGLEAEDMILYIPFFKERFDHVNFLVLDACAHGQSDGYIRGLGIKDAEDLALWCKYVVNTFGDDHKIVIYGKEMGANTAINASGRKLLTNVEAIISDGAYTSPYDIIKYRLLKDYKLPGVPTVSLLRNKIYKEVKIDIKKSTVLQAKHNDIPTIFLHMKEDDFVPLKMVYPLYNACRSRKALLVLKDERYLYDLKETNEYKDTLVDFLDQNIK